MVRQGLFEFLALGVRVGGKVHALHGLPDALRRADGADAGAEVQDLFRVQPQGAQFGRLYAAVDRSLRQRATVGFRHGNTGPANPVGPR